MPSYRHKMPHAISAVRWDCKFCLTPFRVQSKHPEYSFNDRWTMYHLATITNQKDGSTFIQSEGDTILRTALRAGVGITYECNSGGCGGCKFELISGNIENLWPEAPGLSQRDKQRGRHLACQCRAENDITIAVPTANEYIPKISPHRQSAYLSKIRDITHDIREFCFVATDYADFLPGQYAMLDLPDIVGSRAYSMANTSNELKEWHFQIRRVAQGKGSNLLFDHLAIGDKIGLDGPYGMAYLRTDTPRDLVCVAGGSGLAPMISIARGAVKAGLLGERHLYFFYGGRTPQDVCGKDMLQALDGFEQYIHFLPVISLPSNDANFSGATGYVHEHLARILPKAPAEYEFYFAGPPAMTQASQELLMISHNVPFGQIHFDRFF